SSDKRADARRRVNEIFSGKEGVASLFGRGMNDSLKTAMNHMVGARAGATRLSGLVTKGTGGSGEGSLAVQGIGDLGIKGRSTGMRGYGNNLGGLGGTKQSAEVSIAAEEATVNGSLDKELVRQVIQRNRGQIRFCYESLLNRFPKLGGKVAIRFTIANEGNVVTSSVAQSTAGNSELEQCVARRVQTWMFPRPQGGGSVIVTYPFLFKASGE
ncbi:MAG: TonB family protein, partial [Cystobacter sp.]